QVPDEVERELAAVSGVVHMARGGGNLRGFQAQLGDVFDISEVARLLTIAMNGGRRLRDEVLHEKTQDAGIRAAGVLAGAVDVEETQRYRLQAKAGVKHRGVIFAHELLHRVGRLGPGKHGFDFGKRFRVAISGRRGGVNDATHARVGASAQDVK